MRCAVATGAISKMSRRKYICNIYSSIYIVSRFEKIESPDEEAHAIVYEGLKRGRTVHSIVMYI